MTGTRGGMDNRRAKVRRCGMEEVRAYDLVGRTAIMKAFQVSNNTVTSWGKNGAPIVRVGGKSCAMLGEMREWLLQWQREARGSSGWENEPGRATRN